jgi:hypothetical protein
MFSCVNCGSTNDVMAWNLSQLKKIIEDNKALPERFFLIGDEAFVCTNQFLVPYSGRGVGRYTDSFNYHLSAMRQCIERAFALLVQKWGILWRPLRSDFKHWTTVLSVCAKLHNFCLDESIPFNRVRSRSDREQGDAPDVILNERDPTDESLIGR